MQQLLTLHGGTTFATHESYIDSLKNATIRPERMVFQPKWRDRLQETLGDNYTVLHASMPNSSNAVYEEWKLYFDAIVRQVLEDDCILVGHSLGAVFLVKYLAENDMPVRVKATILVAAPYSDESTEDLTNFKLGDTIPARFTQQAGEVTMFFGHNDPVIAPVEIERYRNALPNAKIYITDALDHFVRPEFPEVVKAIIAFSNKI